MRKGRNIVSKNLQFSREKIRDIARSKASDLSLHKNRIAELPYFYFLFIREATHGGVTR